MSVSQYLKPILVVAALSLGASPVYADKQASDFDSLVSVDWLKKHIDDPDIVVIDCSVVTEQADDGTLRSVSGRPAYEQGHLPTAGFADLMNELSDEDSELQFALPAPEKFVATMEALGVGDDTRVVLYDSYNSVWASRVWWMLRWAGFDRVAILDGGIDAWTAAGHALSTEHSDEPVRSLTLALRPEMIADRDEVYAAITDNNVELVDALPAAHYRGEMSFYGRPGHIPGATNLSALSIRDDSGRLLPDEKLATLVNGDPNKRSIHYCGGGIAASATAFALTRLGYKDVAVYTASLQEWAADPANPLEVSPDVQSEGE